MPRRSAGSECPNLGLRRRAAERDSAGLELDFEAANMTVCLAEGETRLGCWRSRVFPSGLGSFKK